MAKISDRRDPLTGWQKKGEFDNALDSLVELSRGTTPVSLALIDIDSFMAVNEKHGHVTGDKVISSISVVVEKELKDEGKQMFRIGGDELAVILPNVEKETTFLMLEQVRKDVSEIKDPQIAGSFPTVSIGIATYPDDGSTRQEIVRKADDALLRAKNTGRNRLALAREEKMVPKTSHFTQGQLDRLTTLSEKEGVGEAELLREALDDMLKKYQWSKPIEK